MVSVLVVGGGAAGTIAAWRAAACGHEVTLLEGNRALAIKVGISGGGQCNLTHAGRVEELLRAFPKAQARFLKHALHQFGSDELRSLFRREGLETTVRENGRVFPQDTPGSAKQVVKVLQKLVEQEGVTLLLGQRAMGIEAHPPRIEALMLAGGTRLEADVYVFATGGASYPGTGSKGEALGWISALGIPARPWVPALAPIPLRVPRSEWEGLAFRQGTLRLLEGADGRRINEHDGDLVFTQEGLSGPAALELSETVEAARRCGPTWLVYAFTRAKPEDVDRELQKEQRDNPHLAAKTWLHRWVPERAVGAALLASGIMMEQRLKDLGRATRKMLVELVTAFPLGEPNPIPLVRGEVSAGGVKLDAVDPRTMAVKGWENLRVCGELLDLNGPIGGYNLQAAFSTGYVAGSL